MATMPDRSWSVSKLSQYSGKPTEAHWIAVKKVLRYVSSNITHGLSFRKTGDLQLVGYSDSDWGSSIDRRRTTGYCFMFSVQEDAISSSVARGGAEVAVAPPEHLRKKLALFSYLHF